MALKSAAKRTAVNLVRALPWGVRKAVLDALVVDFGRTVVFRDIGRALSVRNVLSEGKYGRFYGAIDDLLVFGRYMDSGSWAPETARFLTSFFVTNGNVGTYLDIGANIGLTLAPIAINSGVSCYAFEPEPKNFKMLQLNTELHGTKNTKLFNVALFDNPGKMEFALSLDNAGAHRIQSITKMHAKGEDSWPTITVEALRLDSILKASDISLPLAVKIDVEGAEPFVIAGGRSVLEKASVMVIEFSPYNLKCMGGDVFSEIEFLASSFAEGAIVRAERNEAPVWCPMSEVAQQLRSIWLNWNDPYQYFDVFVRKADAFTLGWPRSSESTVLAHLQE